MTQAARHLTLYFSGSVEEKLEVSRQLFAAHGQALLQQQEVMNGLARLQHSEAALNAQMQKMDMGSRCSVCAAQATGGCCSGYMAANTDAILLLINQLMGIEVSSQHANDTECCFLASMGCILQIKPIFCLNYNCSHINEAATTQQMPALEKKAGVLLGEQTALESLLLDLL